MVLPPDVPPVDKKPFVYFVVTPFVAPFILILILSRVALPAGSAFLISCIPHRFLCRKGLALASLMPQPETVIMKICVALCKWCCHRTFRLWIKNLSCNSCNSWSPHLSRRSSLSSSSSSNWHSKINLRKSAKSVDKKLFRIYPSIQFCPALRAKLPFA